MKTLNEMIIEKLTLNKQSKIVNKLADAESIIDHLLIILSIDSYKSIRHTTFSNTVIKSAIENWINKNNVEIVEYICHSYDERALVDHIVNYNTYAKKFNLTTEIKVSDYCYDNKKYSDINKSKDSEEKCIGISPYVDLYIRDEYLCISGAISIYCIKK